MTTPSSAALREAIQAGYPDHADAVRYTARRSTPTRPGCMRRSAASTARSPRSCSTTTSPPGSSSATASCTT
ncbi:hypothetical protein [Thermocatellispora tengchongensis]|uniref:hypothetical protein n=1 Tax=Thermocatellispora tengchongensis TaxID=1073253 RepID=UPI0036322E89